MSSTVNIGRIIREIRRARKLTQSQLAERIGKSTDAVSQIERGLNTPSVSTLQALSFALEVSMQDLVEGFSPLEESEARKVLIARAITLMAQLDEDQLAVAVNVLGALGQKSQK